MITFPVATRGPSSVTESDVVVRRRNVVDHLHDQRVAGARTVGVGQDHRDIVEHKVLAVVGRTMRQRVIAQRVAVAHNPGYQIDVCDLQGAIGRRDSQGGDRYNSVCHYRYYADRQTVKTVRRADVERPGLRQSRSIRRGTIRQVVLVNRLVAARRTNAGDGNPVVHAIDRDGKGLLRPRANRPTP